MTATRTPLPPQASPSSLSGGHLRRGAWIITCGLLVAAAGTAWRGPAASRAENLDPAPVSAVFESAGPDQSFVEVAVRDHNFSPAVITITVGTAVRWTNTGTVPHTTTSDQGYWNWTLVPGATFAARFLSTGTYPYHCIYHRAMGMVGTVVVVPYGPGPTPPPPPPGPPGEIVFSYFADEVLRTQTDLYTVLPDGGAKTQRSFTTDLAEAQPSWSPDRRQLAYTASALGQVGEPWGIHVMDLDSGAARRITTGPEQYEPDWRPDGALIAFTNITRMGNVPTRSEIAVVAPDGSGYRVIARLDSANYGIINPSWSPDGSTLAITLSSNYEGGEIYVMNADGGSARRLFSHQGWNDIEPEWSPDGRYLAFASGLSRGAATRHDIWIYDTLRHVGGTVAQHTAWDLRRPAWSPDGRYLVFAAEYDLDPPSWALYVVPALGGAVSGPLSTGFEPDWASSVQMPSPTIPPFPTSLTPPPPPPFPTIPPPEPTLPGPTATDVAPPTFEAPTEVSEPTATPRPPTVVPHVADIFLPVAVNDAPLGTR